MTTSYDEMVTGQGVLRPHWRQAMAAIWGMPPELLREKQARAAAHLAEVDKLLTSEGASPRDAQGSERSNWSIDLLPLILPEAEWRAITDGLAQRARLLNLILDDLYGPQTLIRDQALPPYLVFDNPGFLRPLRHVAPAAGSPHLHFYAADLVRMPNGSWRILADRTQAPAGIGYALHHRSIVARTFPEGFRNAPVRRLQSAVDLWHDSLRAIGSAISDNPRIVLLTPGPHNDAYLEHVLLAQELGIALVQGSDMTVRGNVVYLKTLDGLARVDVIYRRVDGDYCDPLELRPDSALGVAGMVAAMRAGNVLVLNTPGSAAIATPAFAPFLPKLAQQLLGEELVLPAITTWWCGQREPLAEVQQALDQFLLQSTFDPGPVPIDPIALPDEERAALLQRLSVHPEKYVAVERVNPSLAPTLAANGLEPRPVVLRACLVWNNGQWVAVPGGVARVMSGDGSRNQLHHSGVVKDVWVLSDEVDEPDRAAASAAPDQRHLKRIADVVGSRAADDLFWLGRYVERLDSGARSLRATLRRLAGSNPGPRDLAEIDLLTDVLYRSGWIPAAVAELPVESSMFLAGLVEAAAPQGPLAGCQAALRRLGIAQRDRLSLDMWRTIGLVSGSMSGQSSAGASDLDKLLAQLDGVIMNVATFGGLVAENMTRGAGWRFLEIGRRIERGIVTCNIIGSLVASRSAWVELSVRLAFELCDSIITHRKRYLTESYSLPMLDLVLSDSANPRGLAYQLDSLLAHLDPLVGQDPLAGEKQLVERQIAALRATPALTDAARQGEGGDAASLAALTESTRASLMSLSDMIAHKFFSHVDPARSLVFGTRNSRQAIAS